jgi:hypothetical protein
MKNWMMTIPVIASSLLAVGCSDDDRDDHRHDRVVYREPAPAVYDYYYTGGRYYYYPTDRNRWVEVHEVPRDRRVIRVDRLPERPRAVERRDDRHDDRDVGRMGPSSNYDNRLRVEQERR